MLEVGEGLVIVSTECNHRGIRVPDMSNSPPVSEAPAAIYQDGLRHEKLLYQVCATCASTVFFPRVLCPGCGSTRLMFRESARTGTVHTVTVVAVRDADPYNIVLVDLDEGFRVMSRVEGIAPHNVHPGLRVHGRVASEDAYGPVLVFVPEAST